MNWYDTLPEEEKKRIAVLNKQSDDDIDGAIAAIRKAKTGWRKRRSNKDS
jgi:acyl-CoA reductase-like NAD-dependent aldehyde dehydrogenase